MNAFFSILFYRYGMVTYGLRLKETHQRTPYLYQGSNSPDKNRYLQPLYS